jgi:hypothetical protein
MESIKACTEPLLDVGHPATLHSHIDHRAEFGYSTFGKWRQFAQLDAYVVDAASTKTDVRRSAYNSTEVH